VLVVSAELRLLVGLVGVGADLVTHIQRVWVNPSLMGKKTAQQGAAQQRRPAKKGYARLQSSLGDLNVELHCDLVPQTCENWLALARMGYYNGNIFHEASRTS
jgi:hypothetical protein